MNGVTIIFDYSVDGHHLEYLNHIYNYCVNKKNEHFIFIVPQTFKLVSYKLVWPKSQNIKIVFINSADFEKFKENGIKRSFCLCKYLKIQIKKYNARNVFLISLMEFMPFLPLMIGKKTKISGIVYLIYLYRWKKSNILSKISDSFKYVLFSKSRVFKRVFLLNDTVSPVYLNRKFRTSKFKYLPDPFMPLSNTGIVDMRDQLNIDKEKIVCLHFGALTERKGTIDILQSILEINQEKASKYSFIFAGKVSKEIKDVFYSLSDEVSQRTQIIIYDYYVDYDFLGALCLISNYILIPYKNTEQSSGVISYAAQFKVPVVAPRLGLLGKIVKRNKLGILLDGSSQESMKVFLNNSEDYSFYMESNYLENNKVSQFLDIIFKE